MPALVPRSNIHPLCYEHHSEMTLPEVVPDGHERVYACPEPSCFVHYSNVDGYFLNTQNRLVLKDCPVPPHQFCSADKHPMYLVEVRQDHPKSRLWRCPKCGFSRIGSQL
jgi:hypothetical protein